MKLGRGESGGESLVVPRGVLGQCWGDRRGHWWKNVTWGQDQVEGD